MRAVAVGMTCAALLVAGCVVGPVPGGNPRSWISPWSEPGLYGQLADLADAPPAGFSIVREPIRRGSLVLPFPDAALAEMDGAMPRHVDDGNHSLWQSTRISIMRCDCTVISQIGPEATREGFIQFARQLVEADASDLEALADDFLASDPNPESERDHAVVVTHPITFARVRGALDAAGAPPLPTTDQRLSWATVSRTGGGFDVTYATPVLALQGEHHGYDYRLEVVPYDQARFAYYGAAGMASPPEAQMREALSFFMATLGREPPGNLTYDFNRGD
jgi:hypothetical protein